MATRVASTSVVADSRDRLRHFALAFAGAVGAALTALGVTFYRRPFATLREMLRWQLRLAGARERTIDLGGIAQRYFEAGRARAAGEAIVFLHGLGDAAEGFARVLPILAREGWALAPDLAGFGRTPIPPEGMRFSVLTDYLDRFLDAAGVSRATLVGNSLGGAVAIRYAARHPERVARLFLLNSAGTLEKAPAALEPTTRVLARELVEISTGSGRVPRFILDDLIRRARGAARVAYLASDEPTDVRADLPRVVAPTTIVWGERDRLIPLALGERLREAIAGAELIVLPGVGHVPQAEAPRRVAAIIRERLRGDGGTGPGALASGWRAFLRRIAQPQG